VCICVQAPSTIHTPSDEGEQSNTRERVKYALGQHTTSLKQAPAYEHGTEAVVGW